ncbi:PTS sugar transporter subunit IIA, partial [Thomasclavelia ramosa]|uniref:PTS sugar transporter subunit IIA n=1 Tax=Thomasclavelia ramosa TaxID=1547 RepID=UPI001C2BD080
IQFSPKKYYNISDLLGENCIRYVKSFSNWKDAIKLSTDILIQHGCIKSEYYEGLMSVIKESGFYAVTDSKFALFHSGNTSSVKISSMSLIVTDEPVWFDNKQVRVIFCLASKDKKEHIPAIVKLMRMVNDAKLIEKLESCNNQNNIIKVINECEKEVLSQYI